MIALNKKQVKKLHKELIDNTGGLHGTRDENLLESALAAPFHTFDGEDLYPSTTAKIARITHGLVRNHPFVDGNKRIGTYVMMILLKLNGINANFTDDDIVDIGMNLANGQMNTAKLHDVIMKRTI